MRRNRALGLLTAVFQALVLCGTVHADDCPSTFLEAPPPGSAIGGIYFQGVDGRWGTLASGSISFPGHKLELLFVPGADLCADPDDDAKKRLDCGDEGFVLVKTIKKTGATSDGQVKLERGNAFARETRFKPETVELQLYQAFHKDPVVRANSAIREKWHTRYKVAGTERTTYQPAGKRLQFAFADDAGAAWRVARLLRFATPAPGQTVCVPFDVAWNTPEMELRLDVLLLDPVLDDFGFDASSFKLTRGLP